ncbi:MAG: hypothetical protein Q9226_005678 [Calogaya cf. arnoldii]
MTSIQVLRLPSGLEERYYWCEDFYDDMWGQICPTLSRHGILQQEKNREEMQLARYIQLDMPQEIKNAIAMEYFHSALVPGKVFPQQLPNSSGLFECWEGSELYRPADVSVFQSMDHSLYTRFRKLFCSENTWVIGPGEPPETVAWLQKVPPETKKLIKKVEIKFTIEDLDHDPKYRRALAKALGQYPMSAWKSDLPVHPVILDHVIHRHLEDLEGIWKEKYRAILELELDELTLDFSDAVMLNGHYIGTHFALWILGPKYAFTRQFPQKLNVWSPDTDESWAIHEDIRRHNRVLLETQEGSNGPNAV